MLSRLFNSHQMINEISSRLFNKTSLLHGTDIYICVLVVNNSLRHRCLSEYDILYDTQLLPLNNLAHASAGAIHVLAERISSISRTVILLRGSSFTWRTPALISKVLLLTTSAAVVVRQVFVVRMARRAACSIGARNLLECGGRDVVLVQHEQHVCTLLVL